MTKQEKRRQDNEVADVVISQVRESKQQKSEEAADLAVAGRAWKEEMKRYG